MHANEETEGRSGIQDILAVVRRSGSSEMSGKDFLAIWNQSRKGYGYVATIKRDLIAAGVMSEPPVERIDLGSTVLLKALSAREEPQQEESARRFSGALPAKSLSSEGLVSIRLNDSLAKAQTLMMRHDFSQLAVMRSKHELAGAVSWESIGKAKMHSVNAGIAECLMPAQVVDPDSNVLDFTVDIMRDGFIFVRNGNREVSGIVTGADMSRAFDKVATPFLEIGAIEAILRSIIEQEFTTAEMMKACAPHRRHEALKVDDLTLGELIAIFDEDANWLRLGWQVDAAVFRSLLQVVVKYRNDFMHFRSDPEEHRLADVRRLRAWLTYLA